MLYSYAPAHFGGGAGSGVSLILCVGLDQLGKDHHRRIAHGVPPSQNYRHNGTAAHLDQHCSLSAHRRNGRRMERGVRDSTTNDWNGQGYGPI